jgi:lipopolysaccharide biosynthesis glycosyltransferase
MEDARNVICVCADKNMLPAAAYVAARARAYVGQSHDTHVMVFVGSRDITATQRRWFEANGIDVQEDTLSARVSSTDLMQQGMTPASLSRLVLAEHLAGRYRKILYVDADVTIPGDITRVFSLETGSSAFAAVRSAWFEKTQGYEEEARLRGFRREAHYQRLGMKEPFLYVNVGVMYIDVHEWNRLELTARAVEFIRRKAHLCQWYDQDVLNAIHENSVTELSPIWNMRFEERLAEPMYDIARPIVRHHVGRRKPWHRFHGRKPLLGSTEAYRLYEAFFRNTPWSAWLRSQWTHEDLRANIASELIAVGARIRGRSDVHRRAYPPDYVAAFERYCHQGRFADVDQAIARWEGKQLCLSQGPPAPTRPH